ncbi:grf1-interacting factor [Ancistrocladus abbreviatus]
MQHHQQQPSSFSTQPSVPTTNITTEQIQKYLDENKRLILAIMEYQNLGKLAECAGYQDQLQKNLMYLAAIADAQPQATPTVPAQRSQVSPQPNIQQGHFVQHAQFAMPPQQPVGFGPRLPFQINAPRPSEQQQSQHLMHLQQQQQQPMAGPMVMTIGPNSGVHPAMRPAFGPASSFVDAHGRRNALDAGSVDVHSRSSGVGGSNRES